MAVVVIDETALRAIIGDDVELLRERLDAGADPARRDPDRGYTLLQVAAQQGAVDAGRVLLAAGADPNAIDGYGERTALDSRLQRFAKERSPRSCSKPKQIRGMQTSGPHTGVARANDRRINRRALRRLPGLAIGPPLAARPR